MKIFDRERSDAPLKGFFSDEVADGLQDDRHLAALGCVNLAITHFPVDFPNTRRASPTLPKRTPEGCPL